MSVWVITNQKGGVGKTTTAVNLAYGLGQRDKKVLLIDLDPQGNAGSGIGVKATDSHNSSNFLADNDTEGKNILQSAYRNVDVIPANQDLVSLQAEFVNHKERDLVLRKILGNQVYKQYDYIIIDTPPSLGMLGLNALIAADYLLIPIQAEYYALEGLGHLLKTVTMLKQVNPNLKVAGLLITMFMKRTNLSQLVEKDLREHFGDKVFKAVVPRSVRLAEAPSFGKPISVYQRTSTGAQAYDQLVEEVLALS